MNLLRLIILFSLAGSLSVRADDQVQFRGTWFHTYIARADQTELFWLGADGKPLRELRKVQAVLKDRNETVHMLMNAGIFESGGVPSGLCVIDHQILHPLNTATGEGNFYLKPTGIFYVDTTGAHVVTTEEYAASHLSPRVAIQSGPLLLRAGKMHPAFREDSTSRLHRNGVGILPDGSVLFAMTEFSQLHYPNLFEFAMFFRKYGCIDALFLDGDLSEMAIEPRLPLEPGNNFGAILAVVEKPSAKAKPTP